MSRNLLGFLLAVAPLALSQTDRGILTGSVLDASGAAIPEARVTATNAATGVGFSTSTTSSGDFTIPAMPVGSYTVRVEKTGFKAASRAEVIINAGSSADFKVTLELGSTRETVEVSASLDLLQTTSAKVSTAVTNKMVDELPLVVGGGMRGAFNLAVITPEANNPEDKGFNIGGGQAGGYGATLDGVSILTSRFNSVEWANVNTPSVDAITEFSVETNGFKAEYGRAQGGMITFSSKSGSNEYHGNAYEFLRNDVLDARRFFEDRKGKYKQHDFGWTIGGPVRFPKLYDGRNRTFFFASGEWFRNRVGAGSGFFSIPTPEMFNGDFRNWVDANGRQIPIYDPSTTRPSGSAFARQPFAGNQVPQARFANISRSYVNLVRDLIRPNNGAAPGTIDYVRNNYINNVGTSIDPWTKYSVKADHNVGANNRLSFLYNYGLHETTPGPEGFPGLPGALNNNRIARQKSDVYRGTWDKVVTPRIVNHFFGGVNFWKEANSATTLDGNWSSKGICLKGAWDCNRNLLIAEFSDYSTWVARAYDGSENFVFSIGNDLTITQGKHTWKLGYLWERMHYNGFGQQTIGGLVRGDRRLTSVPNDNNINTGGGNGFAAFLIGEAFQGGTESDRFVGQQFRSHAWYLQDDWKVTPKLTLNLGLRYEFTLPPLEQIDRWSDFDPLRPNPRAGNLPGALKFAGFGPGRENARTITPGWYGAIGPRFGLAYALGSKTVLRANASRSFGVVKAVTGSTHFEGAILPYTGSTSLDNGITPIFRYDEGLPPFVRPPVVDPSFSNGQATAYWDNEAVRLPQNYQWTFSVQRQVSSTLVVEGNYNATVGANLVAGLKRYNQLPYSLMERYGRNLLQSSVTSPAAVAAGIRVPYANIFCDYSATCAQSAVSVAQALRPFPQYRDINTGTAHGDKSGHSSYHAVILKADKRYSHGVTMQGSYVFSKLITDADSYDADNSALDHYNRRLEKSIGEYDLTHNLKLTYIQELPFGKGRRWAHSGPASWVIGGWRIAATHFYSSGYPLGLGTSAAVAGVVFGGRNAPHITNYEGWIRKYSGNPNWKAGPGATPDVYYNPASQFVFDSNPATALIDQPADRQGNMTRLNPKARQPWNLNENFSLAKTFPIREQIRVDFRWELFNAFNRFRVAPGNGNPQDPNFGRVTGQLNGPRRMQFALKLYF